MADGTQMVPYIDTGLTSGATYYYDVSEVTSGNLSNRSNQVSVTTGQPPLSPAQYLTAQGPSGEVLLYWSPVSGATGCVVTAA